MYYLLMLSIRAGPVCALKICVESLFVTMREIHSDSMYVDGNEVGTLSMMLTLQIMYVDLAMCVVLSCHCRCWNLTNTAFITVRVVFDCTKSPA